MIVLLVHSKSKALIERLAQPRIGELLPPRIDEPALRARRRIVGQHVALDPAVLEGGKIVARRPGARGEFLAEQIIAGGKAFEADVAVAIIFEAHGVEIVLAARHRQIGAPPVLDALIFDVAARLEAADLVGAGAERHVERRFIERFCRVIGARKNRQAGDEQRHVARALRRKAHGDAGIVVGLGAGEIAQRLADQRMAFLFQNIEREGDVVGGQPRAVVEFRLRADEELIGEAVGGAPHFLGGKAVHGVRLVAAAHHQRGEGQLHALRRVAFEDVAVERIEGEEILVELPVRPDLRKAAALRRVRIDVAEVLEVGRVGEIAERREAVRLDQVVGAGAQRSSRQRQKSRRRAGRKRQHAPPGGRAAKITNAIPSWPLCRRPTTTGPETPTRRISATDRDG